MKTKNNRGFTLIEVIGVVIILGIIAVIAISTYRSNERTFREEYYDSLVRTITDSGQEYFTDYRKYKPNTVLEARKVPLVTLETENYIETIKDYKGEECNKDSYVLIVKEDRDNYSYHTCLICETDEYNNTEDPFCDPAWLDNENAIRYTIENFNDQYIYLGTSQDELRELLRLPVSVVRTLSTGEKVYREGTGIDNIPQVLPIDIDRVDTENEGEYKVTYEYQVDINTTEREEVRVFVYQNKMLYPTMKYTNIIAQNMKGDTTTVTGTFISGNWAQKVSINLSSEAIVEPRVNKVKYQWNKDGVWQDFCMVANGGTCSTELISEMSQEVKFRMIDSNGHVSTETEAISINIDTTAPTCELRQDGPKGLNDWYIGEVNISFQDKRDLINMFTLDSSTVSGVRLSNIIQEGLPLNRTTSLDKLMFYDDMKYVKFYGYVEDQAGNFAFCSTSFKIDVSPPVCELQDSGEKILNDTKWWTSDTVVINLKRKEDPTSGLMDYGMADNSKESFNKTTNLILDYDVEDKEFYGFVKNNAGVVGSCVLPVSRDTVPPGCTLGASGTEGLNDWFISDVVISLTDKSDETSKLMSYDIEETIMPYLPDDVLADRVPEKTITLNYDTTSKDYFAHTQDNAGHISRCDINVKRDTVPPSVTIDNPIYCAHNSGQCEIFDWSIFDETSKIYGYTIDNSVTTPSVYVTVEPDTDKTGGKYEIDHYTPNRYYVHAQDNAGLVNQSYIDSYLVSWVEGEGTTLKITGINDTHRTMLHGSVLYAEAKTNDAYYNTYLEASGPGATGTTYPSSGTISYYGHYGDHSHYWETSYKYGGEAITGNITFVSSATICPEGYRDGTGAIPIESCMKDVRAGRYVANPRDKDETLCVPGYYRNIYENVFYGSISDPPYCFPAEPGYYVPTEGAGNQTPCSCGSYTDQYAQTECIKCSPGYYQDKRAQTSCKIAEPGHYARGYSSGGYGACSQPECSCGTWNSLYGQSECTKCEAGYYLTERGLTYNACKASDAGHYVGYKGACQQTVCPAGSAQNLTAQSSCNNCGSGTYQPNPGQTTCLNCDTAHGYWSIWWHATSCYDSCVEKTPRCRVENKNCGSCDVSCGYGSQSCSASNNCYSADISTYLCSSSPTTVSQSCYAGSCEPPCDGQSPGSRCSNWSGHKCVCSDGSCGSWYVTGTRSSSNPPCCTSDKRYGQGKLVCNPHIVYDHGCSC